MTESVIETLLQRLNNHTATIAVLGIGYVGLPLAVVFAEAGFNVIGIDPSEEKVSAV
jgi:UDP-N-acetyl-D-glucosamine dehydrogenase